MSVPMERGPVPEQIDNFHKTFDNALQEER